MGTLVKSIKFRNYKSFKQDDYVKSFLPNFEGSKVDVARRIAPNITVDDFPLDLNQRVRQLHQSIELWNHGR